MQYLATGYDDVLSEYKEAHNVFGEKEEVLGFTVSFGEGGLYGIPFEMDITHQIGIKRYNTYTVDGGTFSGVGYTTEYLTPVDFKSTKSSSSARITRDAFNNVDDEFQKRFDEIQKAKDAALEKLGASVICSIGSMGAAIIPGGTILQNAIKGAFFFAQTAIKGLAGSSNKSDYVK